MSGRVFSTRTLVVMGVGLASMLALYTLMPFLAQDSTAAAVASNLGTIIPVGIASVVAIWAARTFPRGEPMRLAWLFMGLSIGSVELASIVNAYYEVVLKTEPPSPGLVDVLYIIGYPLAGVALIVAIRAMSARANPRNVILVSFGVAIPLGVALWYLVLRPVVANPADALNAAYALGDLVLLIPLGATLAYLVNRLEPGREALPWWIVVAGLTVTLAADTFYALATATGAYLSGGPVDLGLTLGYFTLGVAASVAVDVDRPERAIAQRPTE